METRMTYPATTYAEGVELTITSGNQLHEIINGSATEEISTESGMVPSVRKALADAMLFKPAIAWAQGSTESDPFQTRLYGEGIYWAPSASNEAPISMGENPNTDGNWFLAPVVGDSASTLLTAIEAVNSVADLVGFSGTKDDQQISLKGWHPNSDVGGGILYWDAAKPKSEHNGGTVFSPTVPFNATTGDYLDGIGETATGGSGCWVRTDSANYVHVDQFGAVVKAESKAADNYKSFRAAFVAAVTHESQQLSGHSEILYGAGEYFIKGNSVLMPNRSEMEALSGNYRYRRGVMFRGCGRQSTIITLLTDGTGETWFYDTTDENHSDTGVADYITFRDMTLRGGSSATYSLPSTEWTSGFNFETYGWEKRFIWDAVEFVNLDRIYRCGGYGNADLNTWMNCIAGNIREDAFYFNNNQSVVNRFTNFDISCHGNIIAVGPQGGGDLTWTSGAITQYPQLDEFDTPLPFQRECALIYWDNSGVTTGPSSGNGNNQFRLRGIRVECYSPSQAHFRSKRDDTVAYGDIHVYFDECSFTHPHKYRDEGWGFGTVPYTGAHVEGSAKVRYTKSLLREPYTYLIAKHAGHIEFDSCNYTPTPGASEKQRLSGVCTNLGVDSSIVCTGLTTQKEIDLGSYQYVVVPDFTMGSPATHVKHTSSVKVHKTAWPQVNFVGSLRVYLSPNSIVHKILMDKPEDLNANGTNYSLNIKDYAGVTMASSTVGEESRAILEEVVVGSFRVPEEPNNYIDITPSGTAGTSKFSSTDGRVLLEYY
ncbi:tail tubular protein [Vibrio phage S4-7]|nr:tail tubular protein [Vibrio phage S4-7]